ncbi:MAG: arylsulfatase [Planctomycetota bacterium]|nr:MAG: arylsulfatase [Planctomycetota bacterium]
MARTGAGGESLPHIVLINADDLGYGDVGCYGATKVRTPNIDRLAREGRRFTDAHSASSVCSPSRYGLLTGSYPIRKNLWGPVSLREPLTIDTSQVTIASMLKRAGYETACIGKWHLGFGETSPDWNGELKPGPLELGFDYYFGIPVVSSGPPFVYVENHRVVGWDPKDPFVFGKPSVTKRMPEKGGYRVIGGAERAHRLYVDERVGTTLKDKAVQWLRGRSLRRPFFLYLATTNIHHPYTPAPRFVGTSECGRYGDFIHELDWIVGEVLATLDDLGVRDRTLVIFTSDNGGMLNATGQRAWKAGHRLNGPLLGFKFDAWEGGHRVPLIARWPGRIPAGTVSRALISQIDLLATLAAVVRQRLAEGEAPDSLNQWPNFVGAADVAVRRTLIISPNSPKHLTVRHDQWVYIPARGGGGFQGKKTGDHLLGGPPALAFAGERNSDVVDGRIRPDAPPAQLYDLRSDLSQTTNLWRERPDVVRRMEALLKQARALVPPTRRIGWINLKQ